MGNESQCPHCGKSVPQTITEAARNARERTNAQALAELAKTVERYRAHNDEVAARYYGIRMTKLAGAVGR